MTWFSCWGVWLDVVVLLLSWYGSPLRLERWVCWFGSGNGRVPSRCSIHCPNQLLHLVCARWIWKMVDSSLGIPIWLIERVGSGGTACMGSDWSSWWVSEFGALNNGAFIEIVDRELEYEGFFIWFFYWDKMWLMVVVLVTETWFWIFVGCIVDDRWFIIRSGLVLCPIIVCPCMLWCMHTRCLLICSKESCSLNGLLVIKRRATEWTS